MDEWTRLPWWQRRLYLEGMQDEADRAGNAGGPAPGGGSPADAILAGTMGDLSGLGFDAD